MLIAAVAEVFFTMVKGSMKEAQVYGDVSSPGKAVMELAVTKDGATIVVKSEKVKSSNAMGQAGMREFSDLAAEVRGWGLSLMNIHFKERCF